MYTVALITKLRRSAVADRFEFSIYSLQCRSWTNCKLILRDVCQSQMILTDNIVSIFLYVASVDIRRPVFTRESLSPPFTVKLNNYVCTVCLDMKHEMSQEIFCFKHAPHWVIFFEFLFAPVSSFWPILIWVLVILKNISSKMELAFGLMDWNGSLKISRFKSTNNTEVVYRKDPSWALLHSVIYWWIDFIQLHPEYIFCINFASVVEEYFQMNLLGLPKFKSMLMVAMIQFLPFVEAYFCF